MISNHLSKVNTASPENSIWRDLDHVSFRRHMIAFQQASKEVPSDPEVHSRREWENPRVCTDDPSHTIPFDVEQRLADDLAFLAAAEAGGNSVSAVGLEQSIDPVGLVVRLAANEGITQDVYKTFESIFGLLRRCATKSMLIFKYFYLVSQLPK